MGHEQDKDLKREKLSAKSPEGSPGESNTYRQMLVEVEGICREIAAPDLDLDHMISKVERGYQLIKSMRSRLDATREKIDQLRVEMEAVETPDANKPK